LNFVDKLTSTLAGQKEIIYAIGYETYPGCP
jgi:hypothetical protein